MTRHRGIKPTIQHSNSLAIKGFKGCKKSRPECGRRMISGFEGVNSGALGSHRIKFLQFLYLLGID